MSIQEQLESQLKQAMRARDQGSLDVIRMVRSRVMEARTAKGFSGEVDDALHLDVIARYAKQLKKALPDYEAQGERGHETVEKYRAELEFLAQYLPKKLSAEETRLLVSRLIEELGLTSQSELGRMMGAVMKGHKDSVDAGLVRAAAMELLE